MFNVSSSSSQRNVRAIHPVDDNTGVYQSIMDTTIDHSALQSKEESLPGMISVGSGSGSDCSSCDEGEASYDPSSCPVTGRLSNVLDDYIVFPNVLGEGHYGCVRECIHRDTWKKYACKTVEKSRIKRIDHLRNEVHLLSEMNHPGIIEMVDCYEDADSVHMVTEMCTGGELFYKILDNVTDDGCCSEHKTACIIKSVLEAVAYLHENDIVHRDIKPENILLESKEEEVIKLIDFGLSRRHEEGEASMSNTVGTSYYMSPEMIKGKYDKSCDVWSIGTIAFTLLCGYPPFNGETDSDIFRSIIRDRLEFPVKHWASKSREAKDFINCLLRRDTQKRYTAKEALKHPWIKSLGRKHEKKVQRVQGQRVKYLKIP